MQKHSAFVTLCHTACSANIIFDLSLTNGYTARCRRCLSSFDSSLGVYVKAFTWRRRGVSHHSTIKHNEMCVKERA